MHELLIQLPAERNRELQLMTSQLQSLITILDDNLQRFITQPHRTEQYHSFATACLNLIEREAEQLEETIEQLDLKSVEFLLLNFTHIEYHYLSTFVTMATEADGIESDIATEFYNQMMKLREHIVIIAKYLEK